MTQILPSSSKGGVIMGIVVTALKIGALSGLLLTSRAFSGSPQPTPRESTRRLAADTDPLGGETTDSARADLSTPPTSTAPTNPLLAPLSEGLRRTSLAMRGDTSDRVFESAPSLRRLRRQVQKLTRVAPSSLGERAGLGLFAAKNIKAGTVVGLYPAHALGYEPDGGGGSSLFLASNEEDERYFAEHPHGSSPYLHATDQPLFRRPSLLSPAFDGKKGETAPPLYLDVNPNRNGELDDAWTSHYINDGASLLDARAGDASAEVEVASLLDARAGGTSTEAEVERYYAQSAKAKNCIHIPFGPSPILATTTTRKVKKGQELFTSYGAVYWLGAVDAGDAAAPGMTDGIKAHIVQSARDLQNAMDGAKRAYASEMADLDTALGSL